MQNKLSDLFRQTFNASPQHIARAPGRVNLLGEHVDYNAGFVLPAAIDRATYLAFSASPTERSALVAADFAEKVEFTPESLLSKRAADGSPLPAWALYPAGVAWALNQAGLQSPAIRAVFGSDVPRGAGLSSSASVEMAFAVAWQALGGWSRSPMQLAQISQRAENEYVGVHCGIMDQFASACGQAGSALLLDCRSLEWTPVPLPDSAAIVIADTSVRRSLATSAYNDRRAACEQAVAILSRELPGVTALRDVAPADFELLAHLLPARVAQRARHVVEEVARTRQAVELLRGGDVAGFGVLMNACHVSLRDLYEVSVPALDVMVRIAQSLPGCYGARLTGAGFGGCTVNLVAQEQAGAFAQALAAGFKAETGLSPEIYVCQASAGAGLVV